MLCGVSYPWSTAKFIICDRQCSRMRLKCDDTRAETRFRLSANRTSPFKSSGASVQSIAGSRGVRISASNAGYTMFRGSVKSTGYPLHSPVSPSLPFPVRHRVPSHFNWSLRNKFKTAEQILKEFNIWKIHDLNTRHSKREVHKFSKNLGTTSKFQASEG